MPFSYSLLIARLEPENSIEVVLDGFVMADKNEPFIVIGNYKTRFGSYLKDKFKKIGLIWFVGSIYEIDLLNNLRYYSNHYFHGHTVGGTNPSLLEAMASYCMICAHDNIFNRSILGSDAFYFKDSNQVSTLLKRENKSSNWGKAASNMEKIRKLYSWPKIVNQYNAFFEAMAKPKKNISSSDLLLDKTDTSEQLLKESF